MTAIHRMHFQKEIEMRIYLIENLKIILCYTTCCFFMQNKTIEINVILFNCLSIKQAHYTNRMTVRSSEKRCVRLTIFQYYLVPLKLIIFSFVIIEPKRKPEGHKRCQIYPG